MSKPLNAEALRDVADWLDTYDRLAESYYQLLETLRIAGYVNFPDPGPVREVVQGDEIQRDLRRWADELEGTDWQKFAQDWLDGSGPCTAVIAHGPGHQSTTTCDIKGPHTTHHAIYGSMRQEAEWEGDRAFTGFFDEPYR